MRIAAAVVFRCSSAVLIGGRGSGVGGQGKGVRGTRVTGRKGRDGGPGRAGKGHGHALSLILTLKTAKCGLTSVAVVLIGH